MDSNGLCLLPLFISQFGSISIVWPCWDDVDLDGLTWPSLEQSLLVRIPTTQKIVALVIYNALALNNRPSTMKSPPPPPVMARISSLGPDFRRATLEFLEIRWSAILQYTDMNACVNLNTYIHTYLIPAYPRSFWAQIWVKSICIIGPYILNI